jgi:cell division protein FtsI/penicillin-binding protein 2
MLTHWLARAVVGRTSVGSALEPSDRPDAEFESTWRSHMKTRLLVLLGLLAAWGVALEARLVFLQAISHEAFVEAAREQQQNVLEPEPTRGDILDRNGEVLAYSVESHSVYAVPSRSKNAARDAEEICTALGDCTAKELAKLTSNLAGGGKYLAVRHARFVSPAASLRLRALIEDRKKRKEPAVVELFTASRRYYPKHTLASHILGFAGTDGHGVEGVEAKYDAVIAGKKGRVFVLVDGRNQREISTRVEREPTVGANLELTIDLRLQHIAERELRKGVDELDASGGSVVMMDPFTGEILAMASYPSFNPNAYWNEPDGWRRNRAVTDTYEPGSTFKIVTASAALNEGLFTTGELIDTNPGIIRIGSRVVDDDGKNRGVLTFEDVVVLSSNVGAIMIGQRVGAGRMVQYIRRFGFGEVLAQDFAGQSRGMVASGDVSDSTLASWSMGYEIGVTPLQVVAAAGAVANGGVLVQPHIVRATVRDGRRQLVEPNAIRRVMKPETAAIMTALMEGVAERGTAKAAALERYRVAGKTGTAAKVVNGRYSKSEYNVSFVGFAPSRRPAFVMLVVIDTPRKGRAYGGTMAAPIFRRITDAALQQLGVAPSINPVPPVIMTSAPPVFQAPGRRALESLPTVERVGGRPVMPDVRGLSLRDALRVAHAAGLHVSTDGDGFVVSQSPEPGAFIDAGGQGAFRLRRWLPDEGRR